MSLVILCSLEYQLLEIDLKCGIFGGQCREPFDIVTDFQDRFCDGPDRDQYADSDPKLLPRGGLLPKCPCPDRPGSAERHHDLVPNIEAMPLDPSAFVVFARHRDISVIAVDVRELCTKVRGLGICHMGNAEGQENLSRKGFR